MPQVRQLAALMLAVGLGLLAVGVARAEQRCRCGCPCTESVCRVICEMQKVVEVTYDMECKEVCLMGPSKLCGCTLQPTCGDVRVKRKLVKREVTKEVPVYKCIVEPCCPRCQAAAQADKGFQSVEGSDPAAAAERQVAKPQAGAVR